MMSAVPRTASLVVIALLVAGVSSTVTGAGQQTAATPTKTEAPVARPIVFAYNGGPGSASAWLHMGILGHVRRDRLVPQGHSQSS